MLVFYSERNGYWVAFINVGGAGGYTTLPAQTVGGVEYFYRIKPGTTPKIKVWVPVDGTIAFTIEGTWRRAKKGVTPLVLENKDYLATLTFSATGATGWKANGQDIAWKFMTTIAIQPFEPDEAYTTGNFAYTGARWNGIELGNATAAGTLSNMNPFTSNLAFISGGSESCNKPSDVGSATVSLPNISASFKLRRTGTYNRTPVGSITLIGSPNEVVNGKIKISNTKTDATSAVILRFTPPGATTPLTNRILGAKNVDVSFSYKCETLGDSAKQFRVIYSENETATVSDPGDPIYGPGDVKFVAGKDIVGVTLRCLKDLDYTPPVYAGASEVPTGATANGTISFKNNAGKLTYTATSSDATLFKLGKTSGAALNGEMVSLPTTITCPVTALQKTVTVTVKITNGTVSETKTVTINVNCKKPLKSSIVVTPSSGGLTFSLPVGSSQTQNITIQNNGDVGSALEYIVYGASQSQIVLGAAPGGVRVQAVTPGTYPGSPPPLKWANGTIAPTTPAEGTLVSTVTTSTVTVPVTVTCTKPDTNFAPAIDIVYQKSDLDASGKPLLGQITVPLSVVCRSTASITASVVTPYDGPTQLCPRVAGSFTFDFTGVTGSISLGLIINGFDIGFTTLTQTSANSFNFTTIRSCNYDVGSHTLQIYARDAQGATIVSSPSAVFNVSDNRWTGWLINSTNNCAGIAGLPLDLSLAATGETTQSAANVTPGSALKGLLKPGVTYTFGGTNSAQGFNQSFQGGFPCPFDGDPDTRDGRTGFLFAGFTRVCPAAAPGVTTQSTLTQLTSFATLVPVAPMRRLQVTLPR